MAPGNDERQVDQESSPRTTTTGRDKVRVLLVVSGSNDKVDMAWYGARECKWKWPVEFYPVRSSSGSRNQPGHWSVNGVWSLGHWIKGEDVGEGEQAGIARSRAKDEWAKPGYG